MPAKDDPDGVPDSWLTRPWRELREELLGDLERRYLTALLRRTEGRIGETASRAGMDPRSLYAKMRHFGLRKEDFRPGRRGTRRRRAVQS